MSDDLSKKNSIDELFERIFDKEDLLDEEQDEKCEPDVMEEIMEEARTNPIWFPDGSSSQDILPIEEQEHPRDKYGNRAADYASPPVTPERMAETREIIRKIREELGSPFATNRIHPGEKKDISES
ncbi:hypothetical protein CCAX7_53710 [Capsulimonas corticalis]|uniref:Uncharacterized protein n=1 Tax=Capsulimonas corticalis TaxID=2219043 RepID=A0A402CNL1_9BACT|nr:hypothetical protein [Capsulimonas corticalis]BDI33320.1 hypothetical protein CCAX7_53710 [Capsulimonas corticalis]